ncbi:hypothetical protein ACU635_35130 [[Actinomadura] parvosata]|uniref:hypothetical protein n=1 Tax=[Actinomadura] parvosata TaxID=1955412 RepID=UPI00406BFA95
MDPVIVERLGRAHTLAAPVRAFLAEIADQPQARVSDTATAIGITPRAVPGIIRDPATLDNCGLRAWEST